MEVRLSTGVRRSDCRFLASIYRVGRLLLLDRLGLIQPASMLLDGRSLTFGIIYFVCA